MRILITGGSGFIGTNMIEFLEQNGINDIINFDKNKPINTKQNKYWMRGNIMNESDLDGVFKKYNIDALIHLAARTDTLSDNLDDYKENHEGTKHLINSIVRNIKLKRLIVASTQYVYKSDEKVFPTNNFDFKPHTIYGQSKVLTEEYVHSSNLNCCWTIVRPTNIWGPWHMRYPVELWQIIDKRLYFHPVNHPVIRTYGYVKNIVHQVYQILLADEELVNKKTFYLGDYSIDSYSWLNEFSFNLNGNKIKRLPTFVFKYLAKIGDFLRKFSVPFPLYSKRFRNMVENYPAPTEPTIKLFGLAEVSLKKNILETIAWLKSDGKHLFNYWNNK